MSTNFYQHALLLCSIFICFLSTTVKAQMISDPYEILLKTERTILLENVETLDWKKDLIKGEIIQGKVFRLIQFQEIPTTVQHQRIKEFGITLLDYIPNKAYIASLPVGISKTKLKALNIRTILKIKKEWKQSEPVQFQNFGAWALNRGEVDLSVRYHKSLKREFIVREMEALNIQIINAPDFMHIVEVRVPILKINTILDLPFVSYVDQIADPGEPEDDTGRSLHRSNMIASDFPMGRHYDGTGVKILVRDDGNVGPHIDFKGRIFQEGTAFGGTHGDGVSGVATGAGNLDPTTRGAATGADLYVRNYVSNFLDGTLQLHQNEGVMITNSSYSNGCNAGYTTITETVDQQIHQNPNLMHVFSAGNSNNNDCGYGAGSEWGNITGGHKQGKNVIATANVFPTGVLVNSSSRGPAHDGRIKPDIAANGQNQISTDPNNTYGPFGGTSGAAPCIMGVMAQLYQAYKEMNTGNNPESALIKATILNTANDMGNKGPDFKTGWGGVNAYRAVKLLEDNRYLDAMINQGQNNVHNINIPSGTKQVRFMLYWMDEAANPMADPALVNDLNLEVDDPSSNTLFPYVLDPTPNPTTLDLPAGNGVDNLNNMEQVLVDFPQAGNYQLNIMGSTVPNGQIKYYVVYEIIGQDDITVVYPNGGEGIVANEEMRIDWDALGDDGTFVVEYSQNGGGSWNQISTATGVSRFVYWTPNITQTGNVKIRVSRNGVSDISDANFSVGGVPQNLQVATVCPDEVRIFWDEVTNATGYEVFKLGAKYMESVGTTNNTFFDVPISNPFDDNWFAVRALGQNNFVGRRTIAINHNPGLSNCQLTLDVANVSIDAPASSNISGCENFDQEVTMTFRNMSVDNINTVDLFYQVNNGPVVMETYNNAIVPFESVTHTFSTSFPVNNSGTYNVQTWVVLQGDEASYNDSLAFTLNATIVTVGSGNQLQEDFESGVFPPTSWNIFNFDNESTWEQASVIGSDGNFTNAAYINNFIYNAPAEEDELASIPVDLSNFSSAQLSFDLAYAPYNTTNWFDSMRVDIYTDCGNQFYGTVYGASSLALATIPAANTTNWAPQGGDEWRTETINLNNLLGETIVVKFVNHNGYGNNLYLDNINVQGGVAVDAANISLDAPVEDNVIVCDSYQQDVTMTFGNSGVANINAINLYYRVNGGAEIMETYNNTIAPFEEVTYTFNTPFSVNTSGTYFVETRVELLGDQASFNDVLQTSFSVNLIFSSGNGLQEDFESGVFPPNGWTLFNPDAGQTWEQATVIGPNGNSTLAASVNNFAYNAAGQEDKLVSIPINLSNYSSAQLSFDLAYAPYDATLTDSMRVDIYTDCGSQFYATVYGASDLELATVPAPITTIWSPSSPSEWRSEIIDLSGVAGESIVVQFVSVTGFGNNLYLDNINVNGVVNQQPPTANLFTVFDQVCVDGEITFNNTSTGAGNTYQWDFGQGANIQTATGDGPFDISYSFGGTKTITLTATNNAGSSTTTIDIVVWESQWSSFFYDNNGNTVTFTNSFNSSIGYFWEFGDGTTSTDENPVHTYATSGTYNVSLTSGNGICPAIIITMEIEVLAPPLAALTSSVDNICEGEEVVFENTSTGSGNTYSWDFGTGASMATVTGAGPFSISYSSGGTKTIILTATNNAGTNSFSKEIIVWEKPSPSFSYNNDNGIITFTNTSTNAIGYSWDFGDGNTSTDENPVHTYGQSGTYNVTLVGQGTVCAEETFSQSIEVQIIVAPTAAFIASSNLVCVGDEIIFGNNSVGIGNSYSWDFGDGASIGTTTGVGPFTISYTSGGTKTITLTATNAVGNDVSTIEVEVIESPVPSFTSASNFGEITFTNTSTNSTSYLWDFGDGNTSTAMNPTHIYAQSSTYEIVLLGESDVCDNVSFSQTIEISLLAAPVAGFTSSLSTICIGDEIIFENTSSGIIDSYDWSFGAGANFLSGSQGGPYSISYNTGGIKTITLMIENSAGSDMTTLQVEVVEAPVPSFTYSVNNGELVFTNTSINSTSYLWDFGDGNTSTVMNPTHVYAQSGNYEIILLGESDICENVSTAQTVDLTIIAIPNAGLTASATTICVGEEIVFENMTTGMVDAYNWDFGNGASMSNGTGSGPFTISYSTGGTKTITLTATNGIGSDNASFEIEVVEAPVPSFTYTVNNGELVFTNTSANSTSYLWDFGDGNTSTDMNPTHVYAQSGNYEITLLGESNICENVITAQTVDLTIIAIPNAGLTASATTICVGEEIVFENMTTGLVDTYNWDFGNGASMQNATGSGPFTISYSTGGTKTITLTATNGIGSDNASFEIEVVEAPVPSFTYTVDNGELIFTNTSTNSTSYLWDFGDGNTSTELNPTHVYTQSGNYEITLLGESNICENVSTSQTVDLTIIAIPNAGLTASATTICVGEEIVFENMTTGLVDTYNWGFGNGASIQNATGSGPFTISYSTGGAKTITLIATNGIGSDNASFEIEVMESPVPSFTYTVDNGELVFTNTSINSSSYLWDFGDGNTSTAMNPTHVYTQSGNYEITLLGESDICENVSTSQTVDLTIIAIPNAGLSASTIAICVGEEIVFENMTTGVVDTYEWDFGAGASIQNATGSGPFTISYSTGGAKTITLIATNGIGSDNASIEIGVVEAPVPSFTYTVDNGELVFTNTSINSTSYVWVFGDGNTSTETNPTHVYAQSGVYEITLLGDSGICDEVSFTQTVEVEVTIAPTAGLLTLLSAVCVGDEVVFENASTGSIDSLNWDFGEGASMMNTTGSGPFTVTYSTGGIKTITLTATNAIGSDVASLEVEVVEAPVPLFTYELNSGEIIFTNTSLNADSYLWNFGDGNTSTDENPIHTYLQSGIYEITLLVISDVCDDVMDSLSLDIIITSDESLNSEIGVDILPNPNYGIFSIKISDILDRTFEMELVDVSGRVIQREDIRTTFGTTIYEIKNTQLVSGIYFVKLKNDSLVKTLKVVVQ